MIMRSSAYCYIVIPAFFFLTRVSKSLSTISARYPYPQKASDFRIFRKFRISERDFLSIIPNSTVLLSTLLCSPLMYWHSWELITFTLSNTVGRNSMGRRVLRIAFACFSASRSSSSSAQESSFNSQAGMLEEREKQCYLAS